jgi:hypothetical protein
MALLYNRPEQRPPPNDRTRVYAAERYAEDCHRGNHSGGLVRLLAYLDHSQNPPLTGTLVEVRLQKDSAVVIDQVAQRGVQVLCSSIHQLGAVIRIHLLQPCEVIADIRSATMLSLSVGENLDDLL